MYDLKGSVEEENGAFRLVMEQRVDSPAERAYAAWADAAMISSWFTEHQEQELRVGGRYKNSDGDSGEFLEIVPEQRLAFTWEQAQHAPGSWVAIDVMPADSGAVVRLTHNNLAQRSDAENLNEGWSWALDSMKSFLEEGRPIRYNEWESARAGKKA